MLDGDDGGPLSAPLLVPHDPSLQEQRDLFGAQILVIVEESLLDGVPPPESAQEIAWRIVFCIEDEDVIELVPLLCQSCSRLPVSVIEDSSPMATPVLPCACSAIWVFRSPMACVPGTCRAPTSRCRSECGRR